MNQDYQVLGFYWVKYNGSWHVAKKVSETIIYLNGKKHSVYFETPENVLYPGEFEEIGPKIEITEPS